MRQAERKAADLDSLRAKVRRLERRASSGPRLAASLGSGAIDEALPGGGLPLAGLHEILPERSEWDDGPATGFAVALLTAVMKVAPGPLLWVSRHDDLHAPGCAGLAARHVLRARARRDEEVFWALEEGLRCRDLVAVLGEVETFERTAARRLQLAAENAGRPCFLLQRRRFAARGGAPHSPALTRWRVASAPGREDLPRGLVGLPRWRVELLRCRGAPPRGFLMEWDDATGALALAAGLRDRALPAALSA